MQQPSSNTPQGDWRNQLTQVLEKLSQLDDKYAGMGQDMLSYLEGLLYSNGLTYWDYIHLDSLLGLQVPRTNFKDETIFIIYHQMTELMFKLVKIEIENLTNETDKEYLAAENWLKRLTRTNTYFRHLIRSFDIMVTGLDHAEFNKFRMALLPSSGFQSVQFRHIEIMSAPLTALVGYGTSPEGSSPAEIYQQIYWKKGGIDMATGKKTLTLRDFETEYDADLLRMIDTWRSQNLAARFASASPEIQQHEQIRALMREWDTSVNVAWKLAHLSAAGRYLVRGDSAVAATGGTNWRTFLPPKFQKIIFFQDLWQPEEIDEWGKKFIEDAIQRRA